MSPRLSSASLCLVLILALGATGCRKLENADLGAPKLPAKPALMRDAIPLEYGDLVGVSPGELPGWALLFFQRPDKSIVALYVNGQHGIIGANVVEIPRR